MINLSAKKWVYTVQLLICRYTRDYSIVKEDRLRAVARSENPGGHVVLGGDNVPPPLVEIGLGGVHKLCLQEEGVGGQKNQLFVNFYTIENLNGGG